MSFHVVAYYQSIATAGELLALTPVEDNTVTENGDHIYVPAVYNKVIAAFASFASDGIAAQLQSPSLRAMFFPDFGEIEAASLNLTGYNAFENYLDNPLSLVTNEGLDFYSELSSGATPPIVGYGVVFLSDTAPTPAKGQMVRVKATAAIAQSASAWVSGPLTFSQTLPVGTYDIVGMRVVSADGVVARLIFIGASSVTRPGCPVAAAYNTAVPAVFEKGGMGIYGSFNSTNPPSLEILGGAAAVQEVYLDLIKRG